ncbi:pyocin knob domain-containing protein, partial [Vibrio sp. St2]|uniref:pyocin knob domain-containing protein n=1 Tax=Vibrio sp. St2 TaxID=2853441 RepID=UPI00248EBA88
MAALEEQDIWEDEIYQLEETDPVKGGPHGVDNTPHRQLGNRTKALKKWQVEHVDQDKQAGLDPHPQYLAKNKKSSVESAKAGLKDDEWMTPLTTHQAFNQFGLGKGVIFSGDDFHLLTQAGQFRVHTDSSTKNVPFGLEGQWFDVIVTGAINNRYGLIAVNYGSTNEPGIFHKSNSNNVWSDWVELSHSGNLKLPIYPEISTDGNVVGLNLVGTELTVYNNPVYFYGWQLHRINPTGIK